jgi:hypothetical protein
MKIENENWKWEMGSYNLFAIAYAKSPTSLSKDKRWGW